MATSEQLVRMTKPQMRQSGAKEKEHRIARTAAANEPPNRMYSQSKQKQHGRLFFSKTSLYRPSYFAVSYSMCGSVPAWQRVYRDAAYSICLHLSAAAACIRFAACGCAYILYCRPHCCAAATAECLFRPLCAKGFNNNG